MRFSQPHSGRLEDRIARNPRGLMLAVGPSPDVRRSAAERMAAGSQQNVYSADLSAVVSKYIGETEKNLRAVFSAAQRGGALLFFDEADGLFGKRTEVDDSHERYENAEVMALIVSYPGGVVLGLSTLPGCVTAPNDVASHEPS